MNYLTQGDTQPVEFYGFSDDTDTLTTDMVSSVAFSLRHQVTGEVLVNQAACVITSTGSAALVVEWRPGASDLTLAGPCDGEIKVTYATGKVKYYPSQARTWTWVIRSRVAG